VSRAKAVGALARAVTGSAERAAPEASTGVRAYHGSPHDFAAERLIRRPSGQTEYLVGAPDRLPDVPEGAAVLEDFPLGRFRLDKMGTGEGNQAYGSGGYFGEAEATARTYRDQLSADATGDVNRFVNTNMGYLRSPEEVAERFRAFAEMPRLADPATRRVADDPQAMRMIDRLVRGQGPYEQGRATPDDLVRVYGDLDARLRALAPGRMYEVELGVQPADLLDWDAPVFRQDISELLPGMRQYGRIESAVPASATGGEFYEAAEGILGSRESASRALREAGIPGIRYLDAGSRGARNVDVSPIVQPDGRVSWGVYQGAAAQRPIAEFANEAEAIAHADKLNTRNYVIFDERLIRIVRKYGIAGLAAALGVSYPEAAALAAEQGIEDDMPRFAMGGQVDPNEANPNYAGDEGITATERSLEGIAQPQRLAAGGQARGGPRRPAPTAEERAALYTRLEQQYDLPEGYLARVRAIESSDGTRLFNRNSRAAGPFQFIPRTATAMGLRDPYDEVASAEAAARLAADNARALRRRGFEVDAPTLYLAHQQGATGAVSLLQGNRPAVDIVGRNAVLWNAGNENMTGPEFAGRVLDHFRGVPAQPPQAAAPAEPPPIPRIGAVPPPQQQTAAPAAQAPMPIPFPPPPAPPVPAARQRRADDPSVMRDVIAGLEMQGSGAGQPSPIERHLQMVQQGQRRYATAMPEQEPAMMAQGGLARMLGAMGRGNDTLVAHITPREALMLAAMGGSGTTNPYTGFLEFDDGGGGDGGGGDGSDGGGGDSGGGGEEGGGSSEDSGPGEGPGAGPDAAAAVSDAIGAGFGPESSGYGNQGGPGPNASAGMSSADPEGTSQAANMSTATAAQQAGLGVGIADTGGVNPTGFANAPSLAEALGAYGRGDIGLNQAIGFGLQSALSPPGVQIGTLTDNLGLQSQAASINPVGLGAGLAGLAAGIATGLPGLGLAAGYLGSQLGNALGVAPSIVSYTPGEGPASNPDSGGGESDPNPPGVGFNLLPDPVQTTSAPTPVPQPAPAPGTRGFSPLSGDPTRYGFGAERSFYTPGFAEGGQVSPELSYEAQRFLDLIREADLETSGGGVFTPIRGGRVVAGGVNARAAVPVGRDGAALDFSAGQQGVSASGRGFRSNQSRMTGAGVGYTTPSGGRLSLDYHDRMMGDPDTLPGADPIELMDRPAPSRGLRLGYRREF
jgi:hypothetical protein